MPARRPVLLLAAALVAVVWPQAASALTRDTAPLRRLDRPRAVELGATRAFATGVLSTSGLARVSADRWGGQYDTGDGQTVTIYSSSAFAQDAASQQRWASFLGTLLHGSELSRLTMYLLAGSEIRSVCGRGAVACYSDREQLLVAPGADPDESLSAEAVIAHEYGHHVAANRSNAPWQAVDWGTKRWATAMNVCARTRAGELEPGSEGTNYAVNPGEGFAESFRVANERRLGIPESAWMIVSRTQYPSAAALAALEQDVVAPWTEPTTSSVSGKVARRRTIALATPLDGAVTVQVTAAARARVRVELLGASGNRIAAATTGASRTRILNATACGSRAFKVRLTRLSGGSQFSLRFSRP